MTSEQYHATLQELLALYRLANLPAMAAVPNYTTYEDSFAIMTRINGEKKMLLASSSAHRGLIAVVLGG